MRKFTLYTDGSHFKSRIGTGRLGIGSVLTINNNVIETLSMEVDKYMISELYNTSDFSNPTMEMYAVLISLRKFSSNFEFNDEVDIYCDYMGVIEWMNDRWRINKSYIKRIKDDILNEIKSQKLKVNFYHIKGHNGNYYNDMADKLAKGEMEGTING